MIRVRKIAHASYETPDLARQTEYYTDILGLTAVAKDKDAVWLAGTLDHHCVVLRRGAAARCVRLGFQIGAEEDLDAFERQIAGQGVTTARKHDPEPPSPTPSCSRTPRAPSWRCSGGPSSLRRGSPPRASCRIS